MVDRDINCEVVNFRWESVTYVTAYTTLSHFYDDVQFENLLTVSNNLHERELKMKQLSKNDKSMRHRLNFKVSRTLLRTMSNSFENIWLTLHYFRLSNYLLF